MSRGVGSTSTPAAKLKLLINIKKAEDPAGFQRAASTGQLVQYLRSDMSFADIHPSYAILYQKSTWDFEMRFFLEKFFQTSSDVLDRQLYADYHRQSLRQMDAQTTDIGVAKSLIALRSYSSVVYPMNQIKVLGFGGSLFCMGMSMRALVRGRLPTSAALMVGSFDLLRVSYNCYDKQYGARYADYLCGDFNRVCDTVFNFTKTVLLISPLRENFLLKAHADIQWNCLIQGTLTKEMFHIVDFELKNSLPKFVRID